MAWRINRRVTPQQKVIAMKKLLLSAAIVCGFTSTPQAQEQVQYFDTASMMIVALKKCDSDLFNAAQLRAVIYLAAAERGVDPNTQDFVDQIEARSLIMTSNLDRLGTKDEFCSGMRAVSANLPRS